jgi:hypothetical protein
MERWHRWVVVCGVLGMIGFVGSLGVIAAGWLGIGGSLGGTAASLAAYAASLLIGHLGDPLELRRRSPRQDEPAMSPRSSQALGIPGGWTSHIESWAARRALAR